MLGCGCYTGYLARWQTACLAASRASWALQGRTAGALLSITTHTVGAAAAALALAHTRQLLLAVKTFQPYKALMHSICFCLVDDIVPKYAPARYCCILAGAGQILTRLQLLLLSQVP